MDSGSQSATYAFQVTEILLYFKCFLMFTFVLKCFPHKLHCNLNLYDYPCGKDDLSILYCYYNKLDKHVATSKSSGACFICFIMSEFVLKCCPHRLHCNLNKSINVSYPCGKDSIRISCCPSENYQL